MYKKESFSTNNPSELRRNTPMRTQSVSANKSMDNGTPTIKGDSPFNIIVELLRMIVKKIQELYVAMTKRPNTGLIAINYKNLHFAPKYIEQPKFYALIYRLDALSPIRFSKYLKNNTSPINIAFEYMEVKMMIGEQIKPLRQYVEEVVGKLDFLRQEVSYSFASYEYELIEVITAIKNFVSERKKG